MDCAAQFERRVAALPGVSRAILNPTTGRLVVAGAADLPAIQREGRAENYTIRPASDPLAAAPAEAGTAGKAAPGWDWQSRRTALSGAALLAGAALHILTVGWGTEPGLNATFLYLVAIVAGGWGNARKALHALPRLNFNMSVLMTVAVTGAMLIGEWQEAAVVAFLYAVSEQLEAWTMARARRSIQALMAAAPRTARVRRGQQEVEVPVAAVQVGDVLIIRPGETIPMDGEVQAGESAVDQSAITGESVPVEKAPGDAVYAGTLNTEGALEVEVTRLAQDSAIARIIQMVEEAQSRRAPVQALVDRFAAVYTPVVMGLALASAQLSPLVLGESWGEAVYRGLALLVVACPCALVVSTPVAVVSAIANAARQGVLIKGGAYLEALGTLRVVAFDKTGTLTRGEPAVTAVRPLGDLTEERILELAAAVESRSEHPLARAVVAAAQEHGLQPQPPRRFVSLPGRGARGEVNGEMVTVGRLRLFAEKGLVSGTAEQEARRLEEAGATVVAVGTEAALLGLIALADQVRASSRRVVAALGEAGIAQTVMLTGDNPRTAAAVATETGVQAYEAELLPEGKVAALQRLEAAHGKVAMVGDGVNDAPALATATVGIAMGGAGTGAALETADVVLMADDLTRLPFAVRLSRAARQVIRQNIAFSLGVKLLAVLAAAPGWLTLWLAIAADMGASVLVTLNGIRLLRWTLRNENS